MENKYRKFLNEKYQNEKLLLSRLEELLDIYRRKMSEEIEENSYCSDEIAEGFKATKSTIAGTVERIKTIKKLIRDYNVLANEPWISVKDRLPKLNKDGCSDLVFVHGLSGYVGSAYRTKDAFFTWETSNIIDGVDYWMKVPKIK